MDDDQLKIRARRPSRRIHAYCLRCSTRYCSTCDRAFTPKRDSHRRCFTCWRSGHQHAAFDATRRDDSASGVAPIRAACVRTPQLCCDLLRLVSRSCHPDQQSLERREQAHTNARGPR